MAQALVLSTVAVDFCEALKPHLDKLKPRLDKT
jgi:hypothetical protein